MQFVDGAGALINLTGKTASASGYYDGNYLPANAINGVVNDTYGWVSAPSGPLPQWWQVDMGSSTPVPSATGYGHAVQVSQSGAEGLDIPRFARRRGVEHARYSDRANNVERVPSVATSRSRASRSTPVMITHHNRFNGANNATASPDEIAGNVDVQRGCEAVDNCADSRRVFVAAEQLVGVLRQAGRRCGTGRGAHVDFCAEWFAEWGVSQRRKHALYPGVPPSTTGGIACGFNGIGQFQLYASGTNTFGTWTPTVGTKYHIAIYRRGRTIYLSAGGGRYPSVNRQTMSKTSPAGTLSSGCTIQRRTASTANRMSSGSVWVTRRTAMRTSLHRPARFNRSESLV